MSPLPPHLLAALDQTEATLNALVRSARDHLADGCNIPGACAGAYVNDQLDLLGCLDVGALLYLAVARLAHQPSTEEAR